MKKIVWLVSLMALALSPLQATTAATFLDQKTSLEWQVTQYLGESWEEAVAGCNNLTEAGGGWRLPNVKEAASLIQVYKEGPQIDGQMTEAVRSYKHFLYYTSTVAEYDSLDPFWVYYIDFTNGTIRLFRENTGNIADGAPYFCVRGG